MKLVGLLVLAGLLHSAEPPPLPKRDISKNNGPPRPPLAQQFRLKDGEITFELFVPIPVRTSNVTVTIHFHGAAWFIIQEHIRREAMHPLIAMPLGEGSTVYRKAFEDPERFKRILAIAENKLSRVDRRVTITNVELSSFSAGYGAIREILKSPSATELVSAVVLADSMYGSLDGNAPGRKVLDEHVTVWMPFARAAIEGRKTFVITHSDVPTEKYASSLECADALLQKLGLQRKSAEGTAQDTDFPIRTRADRGRFHLWGYGGTDAHAHMTHARHLADLWRATK